MRLSKNDGKPWVPIGPLCVVVTLFVDVVGHAQTSPISNGDSLPTPAGIQRALDFYNAHDLTNTIAACREALAAFHDSGQRDNEARVLALMGHAQYDDRAYTAALASSSSAVRILRDLGGRKLRLAIALNDTGNIYLAMEAHAEALAAYREANVLFVERKYVHGQLTSLLGIGAVGVALGRYEEALAAYSKALQLNLAGEIAGQAQLRLQIGAVYFNQGRYKEAADNFNQALSNGEAGVQGVALLELGQTHFAQGEYALALELYLKALDLHRAAHDRNQEALALNDIGHVYAALGEDRRALTYYDQALIIRQAIGSLRGQAMSSESIARIHLRLGEHQKASDEYDGSLGFSERASYKRGIARALKGLGDVKGAEGDFLGGLKFYLKAADIQKETGDRDEEGRTLQAMTLYYERLGYYKEALDNIHRALTIFRDTGARADMAGALNSESVLYMTLGRYDEALSAGKNALGLFREVGIRSGEARSLNTVATAYEGLRQYARAEELLELSKKLRRELKDRLGEAVTLNNLAELYANTGRLALSQDLYHEVLAIRRAVGDRIGEMITLFNLGAIYERAADYKQALELYNESISLGERLRGSLQVDEARTPFSAKYATVYGQAIRLYLRLNRVAEAFDLSERARARSFLDQIGNAHVDMYRGADKQLVQTEHALRDTLGALEHRLHTSLSPEAAQAVEMELEQKQRAYTQLVLAIKTTSPDYYGLININPLTGSEVQRYLGANTTLLSYFVTPDETIRFILSRETIAFERLPVTQLQLRQTVRDLYPFLSMDETPEALAKLSHWLLPQDPNLLKKTVVIIPHSVLHMVPFAALPVGDDRFFGGVHMLSVLASASSLRFTRSQNVAEGALLSVAQSHPVGLPILQDADAEAKAIASVYGSQAVLNITDTQFLREAATSDLIHVAAHSELNLETPSLSRVVLGASENSDGSIYVARVYSLNLGHVGLVVLSSCETARGEISQGDEVISLSRAFLLAGASTVIASLWVVEDTVAVKLMVPFYKHLRSGMSKSGALAKAQEEVRKEFPHPYYRAGFVLSGDAGPEMIEGH